ncbi:MAG: DUF421 domain-containing protein [Clostridiaceae bacterium]|nr:DUF421 domain-containing protein [Clostridiaceae bacterium]
MNEGLVVIVRSIIGFFSLLIFTRIIGKEQISQLTFFDYVLGITIGSIAATASTDLSSRAWPHWVSLLTWAALGYIMEVITLKWRSAAKYFEGQPAIIIYNGKILEKTLKNERYRISDILSLLRNQGIFDINQVNFAIIESNGRLSVMKKPEYQPLTPKDMNIQVQDNGLNTILIYDGILIENNLNELKKDRKWLMEQLNKQGVYDISEVFLAYVAPSGSFYIDKYSDHVDCPDEFV